MTVKDLRNILYSFENDATVFVNVADNRLGCREEVENIIQVTNANGEIGEKIAGVYILF